MTAVALTVLGVWWAVDTTRIREAAPVVPLQPSAATSNRVERREAPDAPASAASLPAGHAEGAVEVCGLGWVKKPEDEADARALIERSGVETARERILATLRADPGEFARATVLLLQMTSGDDPGLLARMGLAADGHAQARDQLARLAASSSDAKVYALAYKACSRASADGACQLISAEQWARLDPGNAAPWLFMLSTATDRKDRAAQEESLHRIAVARHQRLGFFDAAGTILDALPDDDGSQLAGWELLTRVIGFEAAVGVPLQALTNACKGMALADANRAQTCGGIAEVMTERSDTLLDRMIGTSIGKNVGWPTERHERLRGEYAAYLTAMMPAEPLAEGFDCARLRRETGRIRRHAAIGETGAMREWVDKSGIAPEQFAREERARQQRAASATRAAAASAAASAVR